MTSFTLHFPATVTNGRLPKDVLKKIRVDLRRFEGKRVVVSIKEIKRPRSLKQNAFYHGPFIAAFQDCLLECGYRLAAEDIHAGLRNSYAKNGYTIELPDGASFKIPPSTARLDTAGFEDYLQEIRSHFATHYGWNLPLPNEGS